MSIQRLPGVSSASRPVNSSGVRSSASRPQYGGSPVAGSYNFEDIDVLAVVEEEEPIVQEPNGFQQLARKELQKRNKK